MSISILFGGKSYEHEISIVSAISLSKIINFTHFIFLDPSHEFYLIPQEKMNSKTFSSLEYKQCKKLLLKQGDFYISSFFTEKALGVRKLLSVVHGGDGEDGILSSLLEFYSIPFIAPRTSACVLSFDKHLTKLFAKERGVRVLDYEVYDRKMAPKTLTQYPSIIKPLRLGSSIGVGIARDKESLEYLLDSAFEYDHRILVEPFIEGVKEYNLAGYKNLEGEFVFSVVEEPKKEEFLNFENKYLDFSRTSTLSQAQITKELEKKLQEAFRILYDNCFEGAIIRCDFFVIDDEVYLNEINPIPGSMANYLFLDFAHVLDDVGIPSPKTIDVNYTYIHKIQKAKGKA
ncbi:D-alanine--D-alanine ligase [Helicobacter cholecystus]|uniref:D-alanine--D-alanine ligase n=1 Tax=Helicobacter cholecystus TaxID=45498 RepID=A0A3D8IW06_9HELI|nr:D-alanine--D-alanine ligase [Helicobacter cholecystus]RDU69457.1 D-alanine--D-alanine ligase [Helicobacter cholecystus]VEJ24008.1 D-alanyl-alanine synthetase A [Helicobacter cholecystus]